MSIDISVKNFKVKDEKTILMRIQCENKDVKLDVNFFLEMFLPNGFFNHYLENLYGVSTFNYQKSIFQVTFTKETHETIIDYFLNHYKERKEILTKTGIKIYLTTKKPDPPARRITLYPMPFNVSDELIQEICKEWGKIRNYEFGRHKICPQIRNPYLHIFITDPIMHNIPSIISVNERSISVNIEGQEKKARCIYCKSTTHLIESCPIKPKKIHRPSYAQMISQPKQTPEKTEANFPTLIKQNQTNEQANIYEQLSDEATTEDTLSESSENESPTPPQNEKIKASNNEKKRKTPPSSPSPGKQSQENVRSSKNLYLRKQSNQKKVKC